MQENATKFNVTTAENSKTLRSTFWLSPCLFLLLRFTRWRRRRSWNPDLSDWTKKASLSLISASLHLRMGLDVDICQRSVNSQRTNFYFQSFTQAISIAPLQAYILLLRDAADTTRIRAYTVSEFHTEALQATVSEGLAKGLYVAARAGSNPRLFQRKAPNLPMSHQASLYIMVRVFCDI